MAANKVEGRINFSAAKNQLQYPDFLEVQLKSFRDFFQMETTSEDRKTENLYRVFSRDNLSDLVWSFFLTSRVVGIYAV